jgi:hypothetical protein
MRMKKQESIQERAAEQKDPSLMVVVGVVRGRSRLWAGKRKRKKVWCGG